MSQRFTSVNIFYNYDFVVSRFVRTDFIFAAIAFVAAFIGYLLTMTPEICAGDSGELTTAIYNLGAAHPPGYPLYTMLGKIFTYIPVGSVAFRVNLLSVFFGALTIPFLYLFLLRLMRGGQAALTAMRDRLIALGVSLSFAFSSTMWSQAVIGEVYTLNAVFAPMLLLTVLLWQEEVFLRIKGGHPGFAEKYLLLLAFLLGMSLTNHLLLVGYLVPFFVFALVVFLMLRDVMADSLGKSARRSAALVMGFAVLLGALLIYGNAWNVSLLDDTDAAWTLFGLFIPIVLLAATAVALLSRLPDKATLADISRGRTLLRWGIAVWTLVLLLVVAERAVMSVLGTILFFLPGEWFATTAIRGSLDFIGVGWGFDLLALTLYAAGLMIMFFAFMRLKKRVGEGEYFTETSCLLVKGYIFFLIPMMLYLTLVIRANAISKIPDPPLSWGETANASRVVNHFLRKQYPKAGMKFFSRLPEITAGWGKMHLNQFTPWLMLLVPFGMYALWRRNRLWSYLSIAIFLFFNFSLLYFLSPRDTDRDWFFNEVFFIPSYVIVATWMAFGLQWIFDRIGRPGGGRTAEVAVKNGEDA